jgi:hypothetical protein
MTTATTSAVNNVARVVALKNVKLFDNGRDNVEIKLGKESRVKAAFSYFDSVQGYDIRVSPETTAASGRKYTKVSLSLSLNGGRTYYNGILNTVKKAGSKFAYTGYVTVDGERLKVMVQNKGSSSFYPVSFSKEKASNKEGVTAAPVAPETPEVPF